MASSTPGKKRTVEPDMIVAICAVIVGMCALGVSFYQTLIMREQQRELSEQRRAEMWPNLEMGVNNQGEFIRFIVLNTGIGPARIKAINMSYNGESIRDWNQLIEKAFGHDNIPYSNSQISDRVLPPGEIIESFGVEGDYVEPMSTYLYGLEAELCYCSIYDDCWTYSILQDEERALNEVATCEVRDDDFLQ